MLKDKNIKKKLAKSRRHWAIRKRLSGTKERPRLVIFRSLKHIYAQIVDDTAGKTYAAASTLSKELQLDPKMKKTEKSFKVGELLGEKALSNGISKICFDRAGYKYHGRVKALAEGARKAGLIF
ncbi:MAG: 50S ribosomal protein L18 [Candidatus Cloacimonetes bacterium]|nr:50S ribosomal protein L18 [Candidatus Cloacimonadota bacterium]